MPMRPWTAIAGGIAAAAIGAGAVPAPALGAWSLAGSRSLPVAYNQGIAFDPSSGAVFFSGVTSAGNSGLYRTSAVLRPFARRPAAIPANATGYNHIGDLAFDAARRRLVLPLECYHPNRGGNTCRRAAIGVADPPTLRMRYRVELAPEQIAKAMWVEASPDGRWVWTSSGRRLLAYPAAAINASLAARQRTTAAAGLTGQDAGILLPSSGVTGAAAMPLATPRGSYRLLLSLNRGHYFQVVSYLVGTAADGSPVVAGRVRSELSLTRSLTYGEPEGLGVTGTPLGGMRLHWQLVSPPTFTARLLAYRWR